MSSPIILERNDNLHLLKSYVRVYKTNSLYKMKANLRKNILRIVKKSILGTNFILFYSKHGFSETNQVREAPEALGSKIFERKMIIGCVS